MHIFRLFRSTPFKKKDHLPHWLSGATTLTQAPVKFGPSQATTFAVGDPSSVPGTLMVVMMLGLNGNRADGGELSSNGLMGSGALLTGTLLDGTSLGCAVLGGLKSNGFTGIGALLIGISLEKEPLGLSLPKGSLEGVITLSGTSRFFWSMIGAATTKTQAAQRLTRKATTFMLKFWHITESLRKLSVSCDTLGKCSEGRKLWRSICRHYCHVLMRGVLRNSRLTPDCSRTSLLAVETQSFLQNESFITK